MQTATIMRHLFITGGILLSLLASSCQSNKQKVEESQSAPTSIQVNYVKDVLRGSHILKESKAIALSSRNDDALIVKINRLLVGENRYFVMDRYGNQLIAFDGNGEFVATTKRLEGQGPDNYVRIIDAAIDNKAQKVYVHCDAPYCIMVFDMNLQLLEKISLDYYMQEIADDDKYIYGIQIKPVPDLGYQLLALDKTDLSASPVTIIDSSKNLNGVGFSGKSLTSSCRGVNVCLPFDNVIYQLSNKEIIASYPMDFGTNGVDYDDIKDMNTNQFFNSPFRQKVWSLVNVYETDSTLFFGCNDLYSFVLDKSSKECTGFSSSHNDLMPYSDTQTIPVDGLEHTYAYSCPSKYVKGIKGRLEEKMGVGMKTILDKYDEEDNPVIILCELK